MTTTGMIYLLRSLDPAAVNVYVGSTKNLIQRMRVHKCDAKANRSSIYEYINKFGGWKNWTIEILETIEYTDRLELLKRERYHLEQYPNRLNKTIPTRTEQERNKDNFVERQIYFHNYYIAKKLKRQQTNEL